VAGQSKRREFYARHPLMSGRERAPRRVAAMASALPVVVRPIWTPLQPPSLGKHAPPQMLEDFRQPNAHEALRPRPN